MIDTKSKLVLKILSKECENGSYKIVEISDIIMALPRHFRMDTESVKHILTHLERQDMISIKYDDEDVYCIAILPYGYEVLENETPKILKRDKPANKKHTFWFVFVYFFASLLGSVIGTVIAFYLLKMH